MQGVLTMRINKVGDDGLESYLIKFHKIADGFTRFGKIVYRTNSVQDVLSDHERRGWTITHYRYKSWIK